MPNKLTSEEAYAVMVRFLTVMYERTGSDELGGLVGGMSLLPEGTADPAMWEDWEAALKDLRDGTLDIALQFRSFSSDT